MRFLNSLLVLLLLQLTLSAQGIYLQVEEINSLDVIKYYPGQKLEFTTIEYPNTWRKEKIVKIMPKEGLIILSQGYMTIEDIHSIRRNNFAVLGFGHALSKFAGAWFVYGLYATLLDTGYEMSLGEIIIGSVMAGVGWVVRKLFGKKRFPMDKLYRLRIMDVRMF